VLGVLGVTLWVARPIAQHRTSTHESVATEPPESPTAQAAQDPVAAANPPPAADPVAAPVPSVARESARAPGPDASLDEESLLTQLRSLVDVDPARAYELAKRGLSLFPSSSSAPEMAALAVKSLARQGKRSEARGEAETMVNRYPDSPWAREVERHTGAHPHRNQTAP
jgi:hypothetical protein